MDMDIPPPSAAMAERVAAIRTLQEAFIRAYLDTARPAAEAAGNAFAEFARCLRENAPASPPQDVMFIGDGTHGWTEVDGIVGVDFGHEPSVPVVAWPRPYGKRVVALALEATFHQTNVMKGLFAWVDAHVRARQEATVVRLADELGWPEPLIRRQLDAVQHVLEAAGVGDGDGNLTVPQPVRASALWPGR